MTMTPMPAMGNSVTEMTSNITGRCILHFSHAVSGGDYDVARQSLVIPVGLYT